MYKNKYIKIKNKNTFLNSTAPIIFLSETPWGRGCMTWSKQNNMSCHPKISKELIFGRKGNNSQYNPVFDIPQCRSLVLLGVTMQRDFKFRAHVNLKLIKANKYTESNAMRPNALCHQWRVFVSYGQKYNMFAFHPWHISFGLENA